jgi:hypothetical protein
MKCPVCNLREIPVHTGKGRPSLFCKHPDCVKKRQAKFFNRFMEGHVRQYHSMVEITNEAEFNENYLYAG